MIARSRAVSAAFSAAAGAFFWPLHFHFAAAATGDPPPRRTAAPARPIIYGPGRQQLQLLEDVAAPGASKASTYTLSEDDADTLHEPRAASAGSCSSPPRRTGTLTGRQALEACKEIMIMKCRQRTHLHHGEEIRALQEGGEFLLLTLQRLTPRDDVCGTAGAAGAPRWTTVEDLDAALQLAPASRPCGEGTAVGSAHSLISAQAHNEEQREQGHCFPRLGWFWNRLRNRMAMGSDGTQEAGAEVGSYRILPVIRLVSAVAGTLEYEHVVAWEKGHEDERTASVAAVVRGYREAKSIPLSTRVDLSRQSDPALAALPLSASLRAGETVKVTKREAFFWGTTIAEHLDQVAQMELGDDSASLWARLFGDEADEDHMKDPLLLQRLRNLHFGTAAPQAMADRLRTLLTRLQERSGFHEAHTADLNRERYQQGHAFSPLVMTYDTHAGAGAELYETLVFSPRSRIPDLCCSSPGPPDPERCNWSTSMYQYDAEGLPTSSKAVNLALTDFLSSIGEIVQRQILRTKKASASPPEDVDEEIDASVISTAKHLEPFYLNPIPQHGEMWRWTHTQVRSIAGSQYWAEDFQQFIFLTDRSARVRRAEEMQQSLRRGELFFGKILNPTCPSSPASHWEWNTRRLAVIMTRSSRPLAGPTYRLQVGYGTTSFAAVQQQQQASDYAEAPEITFEYRFDYQHEQHALGPFRRGLPRVSGFAIFVRPTREEGNRYRDTASIRGKPEVRVHWELHATGTERLYDAFRGFAGEMHREAAAGAYLFEYLH